MATMASIHEAIEDLNVVSLNEALNNLPDNIDLDHQYPCNQSRHACLVGHDRISLLGFATLNEFPEGVELLLSRGANPKLTEIKCKPLNEFSIIPVRWSVTGTPLHYVSRRDTNNNLKIALALINYGASPTDKGDFGVTPLTIAIYNGNHRAAQLLLNYGGNPLQQNDGEAVTAFSIRNFCVDRGMGFRLIWNWLLGQGLVNPLVDSSQNTALHVASKAGVKEVSDLILNSVIGEIGTAPFTPNIMGESALDIAISAHNFEVAHSIITLVGCPTTNSNCHSPFQAFNSPVYRAFKVTLNNSKFNKTGYNRRNDHYQAMSPDVQARFFMSEVGLKNSLAM